MGKRNRAKRAPRQAGVKSSSSIAKPRIPTVLPQTLVIPQEPVNSSIVSAPTATPHISSQPLFRRSPESLRSREWTSNDLVAELQHDHLWLHDDPNTASKWKSYILANTEPAKSYITLKTAKSELLQNYAKFGEDMTARVALGPISRSQATYFHAATPASPALLRLMLQAYGVRVQVFHHLDAFNVASLIDAAQLKSSIGLVERAKFLHPLRALFTDPELDSLGAKLALRHRQLVLWGDIDLLLAGIDSPDSLPLEKTINICIAAVCLNKSCFRTMRDSITPFFGQLDSPRIRRVIQGSAHKVSLPGHWTRIPHHFVHGTDPAAYHLPASQLGDLSPNPGEHYSRVLPSNIQLSWPRRNICPDSLMDRFQYYILGWNLIKPASEQMDREVPMLSRNPIPLPRDLLVMHTQNLEKLYFDVVARRSDQNPVTLEASIARLQLLEDVSHQSYTIPLPFEDDDQWQLLQQERVTRCMAWFNQLGSNFTPGSTMSATERDARLKDITRAQAFHRQTKAEWNDVVARCDARQKAFEVRVTEAEAERKAHVVAFARKLEHDDKQAAIARKSKCDTTVAWLFAVYYLFVMWYFSNRYLTTFESKIVVSAFIIGFEGTFILLSWLRFAPAVLISNLIVAVLLFVGLLLVGVLRAMKMEGMCEPRW